MANIIKLKRSSVSGKVPLTTDLDLGELGINTYDGKVFIKQDDGTEKIVEVGTFIKTQLISADYSAKNNELIVCDTSGATLSSGATAYTVTLPGSPEDGDVIRLMDGSGNAQNRPILVDRNGNNIDGDTDNLTCDANYFDVKLVFDTDNWSLGGK